MSAWWTGLAETLGKPEPERVTLAFLVIIGIVFVGSLLCLTLPLAVRQAQLRSMRRAFARHNSVVKMSPAEREELETWLCKSMWRRSVWSPFLRAWNELYDPAVKVAARPVNFLHYCSPQRVIPGIANRRLAAVVPGILVALGIFGTFLGLTLGLPEASAVSPAAESTPGNGARGTIEQLIAGLRVAFQTSLLGIFTSIAFLGVDRLAFHGLERGVRRLADVASEFYPARIEEVLLREDARERAEATKQLKTLATDIAVALENSMGSVMREAVGDAMEAKLAPVLAELEDVVSKLGVTVSGDMVNALQSFSDRINENLSGAFRDSFAELTENLQGVVATQDQMRELLATSAERMQQQAEIQERLTDEVIAAAASLEGLLGSLGEVTERLQTASQGVGSAIEQLSTASGEAAKAQRAIGEAQRQLSQQVREDLARLEDARTSILDGWNAVSAEARDSIAIVQEAVRQLGTAVGDNLLTALGRFDDKLADVTERFSGTLHEARETINELPELLSKMTASAQDMSQATSLLRAEIQGLVETLQSSVTDSTERASAAAAKLSEVTERSAEVASKVGDTIDRAQQTASARQEDSRTAIAHAAEGLTRLQQLASLMEKMSISTAEIHKRLTDGEETDLKAVLARLDRLSEVKQEVQAIRAHAESISEGVRDGASRSVLGSFFGRRR